MDLITFKYGRETRPTNNPKATLTIDTRWSLRLDMTISHTCLSLEKQGKYGERTWHPDSSYLAWGVSSAWALGHEALTYEGRHHVLAFGPLYVAWSRG